jgi:hypothetical protein
MVAAGIGAGLVLGLLTTHFRMPHADGDLRSGASSAASLSIGAPSAASAGTAEPGASPRPRSSAEFRQHELEEHEAAIERHAKEPRDQDWATGMESRVREALDKLADKHELRLRGVDCRTRTCTADLVWPSPRSAENNLMAVVTGSAEAIQCLRRITLPEPTKPGRSVEATMFIDCSDERRDGSTGNGQGAP